MVFQIAPSLTPGGTGDAEFNVVKNTIDQNLSVLHTDEKDEAMENVRRSLMELREKIETTPEQLEEVAVMMESKKQEAAIQNTPQALKIGKLAQEARQGAQEKREAAFFDDPRKWFTRKGEELKELFGKATSPQEWMRGLAYIITSICAGIEKLKDYIGATVGHAIESLRDMPMVGGMFSGVEKFIGTQRMAFFSMLSEKNIELPVAIASYARQSLDKMAKESSVIARGFDATKLYTEFVKLLESNSITGEAAKTATKAKVTEIITSLSTFVGTQPLIQNAAPVVPQPPRKIDIAGSAPAGLTIYDNGSLEYKSKKWRMENVDNGKPMTIKNPELKGDGSFCVTSVTSLKIIAFHMDLWQQVLENLESDQVALFEPEDAVGKKLIRFVRET